MAETLTIAQPFGVNDIKTTIPSDGEIFKLTSGEALFQRNGNQLIRIDPKDNDVSSLPKNVQTYSSGDLQRASMFSDGKINFMNANGSFKITNVPATQFDITAHQNITSQDLGKTNVEASAQSTKNAAALGITSPNAPTVPEQELDKATGGEPSDDIRALSIALAQPGAKKVVVNNQSGSELVSIDAGGNITNRESIAPGTPTGTIFTTDGNQITTDQLLQGGIGGDSSLIKDGQLTPSSSAGGADLTELHESPSFNNIEPDDQVIVDKVFEAIVTNDEKTANEFAAALKKAEAINDPYFASLLRVASDAIQRGYVSIDREQEFKEQQLNRALSDIRQDVSRRGDFLDLEEANVLRGIERQYGQALETTQNNLAASGFTSSSRRAKREQLLAEDRADLVESTNRKFAFEQQNLVEQEGRATRDTQSEVERLQELAEEGKLELLRRGEAELGTLNLPDLSGAPAPLGNIVGQIPQDKARDALRLAESLTF